MRAEDHGIKKMQRLSENHAVALSAGRAANLATHYFAYVAGISVAVAVAAVTLVYSAQTALTWVDLAAFPERHAIARQPLAQPAADKADVAPTEFAMLPSGAPLRIRNEVISTNF